MDAMPLATFAEKLKLPAPAGKWTEGWEESWRTFPATFAAEKLSPAFIRAQAQAIQLTQAQTEALVGAAVCFAGSPEFSRLAWHCHRTAFLRETPNAEYIGSWQHLPAEVHPQAPVFHAVMLLTGVPGVFARQGKMGIPAATTAETLSDLGVWLDDYRAKKGIWGLDHHGWLAGHFCDDVFRLGRLQFNLSIFWYPYRIFLNEKTGGVVALSDKGVSYRTDGQWNGANGINDPQAWTAGWNETADEITASPIHPAGYTIRKPITLKKSEWRQLAAERDEVLSTHIPAIGPMKLSECGESFARAMPFFKRFFPARNPRVIICKSWLMDGQLEKYLKPDSNIVAWLKEWYLLPQFKADDHQIFERVFGGPVADLEKAPRENSLQRAVLDHVKAGGKWRTSGAMLVPQSLHWGKQFYRSTWPF